MIIETPGTVNFWIDPIINPFAFKDDTFVKWIDCKINNEKVSIYSEGKTLTAVMNMGASRELQIFSYIVDFDLTKRHMITLTWSSESIKLYYDAVLQHELNPLDFDLP